MFGGVARQMERPHFDSPDRYAVAVIQRRGPRFGGVTVLPVWSARSREIEPSIGPLRQFARSGAKVGMDVSLGDMGDSEAFLSRGLEVPINVPVGVHDQGF